MRHPGPVLVFLLILVSISFVPASASKYDTNSGSGMAGIDPFADFEAYYAYNIVPTTVRFVDRSSGTAPIAYRWDFGDGATSTEVSPVHVYTAAGMYTVTLTVSNTFGENSGTREDYITIGARPDADFTADPVTGTVPFAVQFTDQSTGHPTAWAWTFGDGTGSTEQDPVHTYWTGGRYSVTLTVSNDYASSDETRAEYITSIPALRPAFDAYPMDGKAPLTVTLTDRSSGDPSSRRWDFGDGQTSTEQNPVHTFTGSGAFDVVLEISKDNDLASTHRVINVGGVPETDFAADRTFVGTGEQIRFTDKTKNSPYVWKWNFGDGTESSEQNPVKAYKAAGVYTVSLSAKNDNGRDSEIRTGYISVGLPPAADFITSIPVYQNIPSRQVIRYIDRSENKPSEWLWDFGDGQTSTEQNPRHLYLNDGIYTVTLTVRNKFGESRKVADSPVTIGPAPGVDFRADKTVAGVGRIIGFSDLSFNNPTTWVWDFGDGSTGYGENPEHAYRKTGLYDVSLTASNQFSSATLIKKEYISITDIPRADFTADKTKGQAPLTVSFKDRSKGHPTGWSWDFGDGQYSMDRNPKHTYTRNGVFTVALTLENADGEDTKIREDYIDTRTWPVADFRVRDRAGTTPFIVRFQDLSSGKPMKWLWEFGDGITSREQNPVHAYREEGVYDVRLTVWNDDGSDTVIKPGITG
jgi:PKD repeat protein